MTTHAEIAALDAPEPGPALLARAARVVAYPAVRAFGTIGGSVAHADPAADYPVALVAANAAIEVASATGTRIALRPAISFAACSRRRSNRGEIVTAIVVPAGPKNGRAAYEKLSLVAGDFAIVSVATIVAETRNIAVGSCGPKPLFACGLPLDAHGSTRSGGEACRGKRSAERSSRLRPAIAAKSFLSSSAERVRTATS